jgi:radical SAM protein with 4Fe4S-binding SPASM domain
MVAIPDYAYMWRPYANPEMICKQVKDRHERDWTFTIDPATQRWLLLKEPAPELLKLADGKRRFADILRGLGAAADGVDTCGLARELVAGGLLYDDRQQHRASSRDVYNKSDIIGMHIEITNACNMTCTHCYVASGNPLPNEMTAEQIRQAIDLIPPFSGKRIAISGGEPIVRKGCMDIVEYCALDCGHDVDLYTNGRKFPEKFALRIRDINTQGRGYVRLQLSLEGATAITHDLVRGPGAFHDAMESLSLFSDVGLNRSTVLFVCLTRANMHELDDMIRLAEKFDVAMLVFSQWQRQGNAAGTPWGNIAPSVDEWVAAGEKLLAYDNPRLQVFGNFYGDLSNNSIGRLSLDSPIFPKHLYYYNAFPRITPQGDVFADQLWVDPDWILGNIKHGDTFDSCFESPKFYAQLEAMRKRTHDIEDCQKCEWRRLCEGGSAGHTYAEYGHMAAKDLFCESRIRWFNRYVEHQVARICD